MAGLVETDLNGLIMEVGEAAELHRSGREPSEIGAPEGAASSQALALSALHGERGAVVALDVLLQRRRAFIGVDIENDLALLSPNVSSDYLGG